MDDEFLLDDEASSRLFHEFAEHAPILDFHCHLPPAAVARDDRFSGLAEAWLGGDHYKWRAMRSAGIPERLITGDAGWDEKFEAWATTVPRLIGNPLYHWTHLELQRYFGVKEPLSPASASGIRRQCDAIMAGSGFSVRGLLRSMKVLAICTTDDPADDLASHLAYARERGPEDCIMVPTFRPDKAMNAEDPVAWNAYMDRLGTVTGTKILDWESLADAISVRHEFFHLAGCRLSDHALEVPLCEIVDELTLDRLIRSLRSGQIPSRLDSDRLKTAVLLHVGTLNAAKSWTTQLHMGAIRNLNSRMFSLLGPDTGYDAIADGIASRPLAAFLNALDRNGTLPPTILYTLNPAWNDVLGTVMGAFQDGSMPGKLQFGSAWWFNDQLDGMRAQMTSLANMGLLSLFVGMLTDSRSFLSFPRHEYFRRLLCSILGQWMTDGKIPEDYELAGSMVKDICFGNASRRFRIPGVPVS